MSVLSDLSLQTLLMRILALLLILPVAGIAAALAARLMGDPGPARDGRLSSNPIVHLDGLGTAAFALFGMGWIKPLQLSRRLGVAMVAFMAQTAAVLALGVVAASLQRPAATMLPDSAAPLAAGFIAILASGTRTFAAFNILPVLPLAGGYALEAVAPRPGAALQRAQLVVGIALLALLVFGYPQQLYGRLVSMVARLTHLG